MRKTILYIAFLVLGFAQAWASPDSTSVLDSIHVPDSVALRPSVLTLPLVFNQQQSTADSLTVPQMGIEKYSTAQLQMQRDWLDRELARRQHMEDTRNRVIVAHPDVVPYNTQTLREPPKEHVVSADPNQDRLIVEPVFEEPTDMTNIIERVQTKSRNWLHTFKASLHFTQAYVSNNWYQGGQNNINVLGDIQWDCNLNQKLHPNFLFENTLHYKVGVMSTPSDSIRKYGINEDNFQFNSKFGYKAIKNWYYSLSLQFKTQMFNTYTSNTRTMKASFLSPAELNVGLGMTYNYKDKESIKTFSLSVAPFSYNLKYCRDIENLSPTSFGIDDGHHSKHSFGSTLTATSVWKISANISWTSRFYVFTNYEYAQGDWENTFDFSVTRHLSTQIYVHLRYDKSQPWNASWKYWQLKEILSFGLTYRFATN